MADLAKSETGQGRSVAVGAEELHEFLAFVLAGDVYAVALTRIREILTLPPITPVPRAPRDVIGVCSVRGLLITLIDMRRRLRLDEAETTRRSRILLVETVRDEVVGLLVDEVKQVIRLQPAEIELASSVLGGDLSEHVLGIGRPADSLVIILDLGSVVA